MDAETNAPAPRPPRPDVRPFRPELTPTWLTAMTVLAGHEPPSWGDGMRVAWFGCRFPLTPLVVATVHPRSEVTVWDPDAGRLARIEGLAHRAALRNLVVHRHPDPPVGDGDRSTDLVVVDEVIDSLADDLAAAVVGAAGALLRPGGLAVLTYRTTVGWSEVTPLVHLLRHLATRTSKDPVDSTAEALVLFELLRERKAAFVTPRPGQRFVRPFRQIIESVNQTLKAQLDLERHGVRTKPGVCARVLQRLLALTAAIWHNETTNQPGPARSLTAYDHRPLEPTIECIDPHPHRVRSACSGMLPTYDGLHVDAPA